MDKVKKEYGNLIITLKEDQVITIGDACVFISKIKGKQIRLGINAPKNVQIMRTNTIDKKKE
jgi:carbon storage regulator CsrA